MNELDKSKTKHQILNKSHYIKIEHSDNNNNWHLIPCKNNIQSKNILEPNLLTKEKVISLNYQIKYKFYKGY